MFYLTFYIDTSDEFQQLEMNANILGSRDSFVKKVGEDIKIFCGMLFDYIDNDSKETTDIYNALKVVELNQNLDDVDVHTMMLDYEEDIKEINITYFYSLKIMYVLLSDKEFVENDLKKYKEKRDLLEAIKRELQQLKYKNDKVEYYIEDYIIKSSLNIFGHLISELSEISKIYDEDDLVTLKFKKSELKIIDLLFSLMSEKDPDEFFEAVDESDIEDDRIFLLRENKYNDLPPAEKRSYIKKLTEYIKEKI